MIGLAIAFAAAVAQPAISDAEWLAGRWVGEGLGGRVEESWAPAIGGQMIGHFQLAVDGKPTFYEIMMIDAQSAGLRLRVRHFNPDFTSWEDKGEWHSFEPVSAAPNLLKFDGLILERKGEELAIVVTLKGKDGTVRDHPLRLRRAPL